MTQPQSTRERLIDRTLIIWRSGRPWLVRASALALLVANVGWELNLIPEQRLTQIGISVTVLVLWLTFEQNLKILSASRRTLPVLDHQRVHNNDLASWIARSQHPKIDVFTHSGENCLNLVRTALLDAVASNATLKSITLRILVRDCTAPWIIPRSSPENPAVDEAYKSELTTRFAANLDLVLERIAMSIDDLHSVDLHLSIKTYRFEPLFKFILVNSEQGVVGFYPIGKVRKSNHDGEFWDYLGERVNMIQIANNPRGHATEHQLYRSMSTLFDTTWDHFSKPREHA